MESQAENKAAIIAIPTGDGHVFSGVMNAVIQGMCSPRLYHVNCQTSSFLPHTFNLLWSHAWNNRKAMNLDRFIMLHSDLMPLSEDAFDKLLSIMDERNADVVSAIVPIKNQDGLTSTAVDTDKWRPRRITMNEVMDCPVTFDNQFAKNRFGGNLLLNTGFMAVRLDREWGKDVCFQFDNTMVQDNNGNIWPLGEPEDWRFSRWCHERSLNIVATREISIAHFGPMGFENTFAWGKMKRDELNDPNKVKEFYNNVAK